MRKCWCALVLALALSLSAVGAAAAQSPPADAMAAARELVVTMRSADQFKAVMPIIMRNLKPAFVQNRPEVERDYDAIVPLMLELANTRVNALIDEITVLYARSFTVAELNDLTAFYRAPTGQKFLEKLPAITQDSMAIGQKFGQAIAADLQTRMAEELRKRGHKI